MLHQPTLDALNRLKLNGMAAALIEQTETGAADGLSFVDRLALLVDREVLLRDGRRQDKLRRNAQLKELACVEDIEYRADRGLDRSVMAELASCDWIRRHRSLLIHAATGAGKTFMACALAHQACRQGLSAWYVRAPRLFDELKLAHADGTLRRRLAAIARLDLIVIDDFAMAPIGARERSDLLELIDDRINVRSTVVTSQLPIEHWHEYIGDPTLADAILDRLRHGSIELRIAGESMRKLRAGGAGRTATKKSK